MSLLPVSYRYFLFPQSDKDNWLAPSRNADNVASAGLCLCKWTVIHSSKTSQVQKCNVSRGHSLISSGCGALLENCIFGLVWFCYNYYASTLRVNFPYLDTHKQAMTNLFFYWCTEVESAEQRRQLSWDSKMSNEQIIEASVHVDEVRFDLFGSVLRHLARIEDQLFSLVAFSSHGSRRIV
jgi:hypothetical protein